MNCGIENVKKEKVILMGESIQKHGDSLKELGKQELKRSLLKVYKKNNR